MNEPTPETIAKAKAGDPKAREELKTYLSEHAAEVYRQVGPEKYDQLTKSIGLPGLKMPDGSPSHVAHQIIADQARSPETSLAFGAALAVGNYVNKVANFFGVGPAENPNTLNEPPQAVLGREASVKNLPRQGQGFFKEAQTASFHPELVSGMINSVQNKILQDAYSLGDFLTPDSTGMWIRANVPGAEKADELIRGMKYNAEANAEAYYKMAEYGGVNPKAIKTVRVGADLTALAAEWETLPIKGVIAKGAEWTAKARALALTKNAARLAEAMRTTPELVEAGKMAKIAQRVNTLREYRVGRAVRMASEGERGFYAGFISDTDGTFTQRVKRGAGWGLTGVALSGAVEGAQILIKNHKAKVIQSLVEGGKPGKLIRQIMEDAANGDPVASKIVLEAMGKEGLVSRLPIEERPYTLLPEEDLIKLEEYAGLRRQLEKIDAPIEERFPYMKAKLEKEAAVQGSREPISDEQVWTAIRSEDGQSQALRDKITDLEVANSKLFADHAMPYPGTPPYRLEPSPEVLQTEGQMRLFHDAAPAPTITPEELMKKVERGEITFRDAYVSLMENQIAAGNPGAAFEAINTAIHDIFRDPRTINDLPSGMQKMLVAYLKKPQGLPGSGFNWGDLNAVKEEAKAKFAQFGKSPESFVVLRRLPDSVIYTRGDMKSLWGAGGLARDLSFQHRDAFEHAVETLARDPELIVARSHTYAETVAPGLADPRSISHTVVVASKDIGIPQESTIFTEFLREEAARPVDVRAYLTESPQWFPADPALRRLSRYLVTKTPYGDLGPLSASSTQGLLDPWTHEAIDVPKGLNFQEAGERLGLGVEPVGEDAIPIVKDPKTGMWKRDMEEMYKGLLEDIQGEMKGLPKESPEWRRFRAIEKAEQQKNAAVTRLNARGGGEPSIEEALRALKGLTEFEGKPPASQNLLYKYMDEVTGLMDASTSRLLRKVDAADNLGNVNWGVVTFDVNNFKLINDVFDNHALGDAVLYEISQGLKGVAKRYGLKIGRMGGDELGMWGVIEHPDEIIADALKVTRNLPRRAPELQRYLMIDDPVLTSVSAGVARRIEGNESLESLLETAEGRLYEAKKIAATREIVAGFQAKGWLPAERVEGGWKVVNESTKEAFFVQDGEEASYLREMTYLHLRNSEGHVVISPSGVAVMDRGNPVVLADDVDTALDMASVIPREPEVVIGGDRVGTGSLDIDMSLPADHIDYPGTGPSTFGPKPIEGKGEGIKYIYQPTKRVMLDVQKDYGYGAYERYKQGDLLYNKFVSDFNNKKRDLQSLVSGNKNSDFELVGQILAADPQVVDNLLAKVPRSTQVLYKQMRDELFYPLFEEMGIPRENFKDALFQIQEVMHGLVPRHVAPEWLRNMDSLLNSYEMRNTPLHAGKLYMRIARAFLRNKHLKAWSRELKSSMKEAVDSNLLPKGAANTIKAMHDQIMGAADADLLALNEYNASLAKRLGLSQDAASNAVSTLLTFQYGSSMAFRVGLPFRNLFQPYVTTSGLIGVADVAKGQARALEFLRNENHLFDNVFTGKVSLQDLKELGVWDEMVPVPMANVVFDTSYASNFLSRAQKFVRWGLKMQHWTDRMNRLSTFFGALEHTGPKLQRALREGWTWEKFAAKADMQMFHEEIQQGWKTLYEQKDWRGLLLDYGKQLSDDTQFMYRTYANPRLFHSVYGKVFGQYGVFPTQYIELMKSRAFQYGTPASRAKFIARTLTTHGALAAAGSAVGINVGSWMFYHPMMYFGGPFMQITAKTISILGGPGDASQKTSELERAFGNFLPEVIPTGGFWRYDVAKTLEYVARHEYYRSMLAMFRLIGWPDQSEAAAQAQWGEPIPTTDASKGFKVQR